MNCWKDLHLHIKHYYIAKHYIPKAFHKWLCMCRESLPSFRHFEGYLFWLSLFSMGPDFCPTIWGKWKTSKWDVNWILWIFMLLIKHYQPLLKRWIFPRKHPWQSPFKTIVDLQFRIFQKQERKKCIFSQTS